MGLLVFGCGATLLNLPFETWPAFSVMVTAAISLSAGTESHRRQSVKHEQKQPEWKRILRREEWGYHSE